MSDTVCYVWSFKDDMAQIPYRIERRGTPKREGGRGVQWSCTCPAFSNRGGKTCKHLITMREEAKNKTILTDSRFQITEFGKQVLKLP